MVLRCLAAHASVSGQSGKLKVLPASFVLRSLEEVLEDPSQKCVFFMPIAIILFIFRILL